MGARFPLVISVANLLCVPIIESLPLRQQKVE